MKSIFYLFVLILLTINTTEASECTNFTETKGNLTVRRIYYPHDDVCSIGLSLFSPVERYREFSFDNNGAMLVFVNYGIFDDELRYGAREFYFLPKLQAYPSIEWREQEGELDVLMINGHRATFDIQTSKLLRVSGAEISVDDYLHPKVLGGVEVKPLQGLIIDTGFALDSLSTQSPFKKSLLKNSADEKCEITNRDLFRYPSNGDVIFRHNNESLEVLIGKKCPQITL
ncbi:hypothetical protein M899_1839 [Bacteriovorax sp. BSW11_IV]|uniref:hypothetical protein n=1 Tax=Bacteriovorax sp. BSW11_IV TaxID=1353529 RepID=UPI00038A4540|nr:hypothetical protein [Bacteriovorax sp. BSW11_IV]EQC48530.1 hypothetical protein M899_1839 [Bacteriovorax sp. BSW11_IV]